MTDTELISLARQARRMAHAPYSHFPVGAAVQAASGRTYSAANVENASYSLCACAERIAIWKAISEGETSLVAIAVVTETAATPCGACRQVMAEFAQPDSRILVADLGGRYTSHTLGELLPEAFTPAQLTQPRAGTSMESR